MNKNKIVLLILIALIILSALLIPSKTVLMISGKKNALFCCDRFNITYIHSVELFRCVDIYEIKDGRLILTGSVTESFGWGLPSSENVSIEEEGFLFKMNRSFESIEVVTDEINDYTLEFDGKSIKLTPFGRRVLIKPEKVNLISYWRCMFET